jgi:hypothetical protein
VSSRLAGIVNGIAVFAISLAIAAFVIVTFHLT